MFVTMLLLPACSPLLPPPGRLGAPAPWSAAGSGWSGEAAVSTAIAGDGEGGWALPVAAEGGATWSAGGPLVVDLSGTAGRNWGGVRPTVGFRWAGASGLRAGVGVTGAAGLGDVLGYRPWRHPYVGMGLQAQLGWAWAGGRALSLSLGLEGVLHAEGLPALWTGEAVEVEPGAYALPWLWPSAHLRLDLPVGGGRYGAWGGVGFPGLVAAGVTF